MAPRTLDEFLNELCPRARPLIAQIVERESECEVLDFFRRRPRTWLEVDDIAYHLRRPHAQVNEMLCWLANAEIVQCRTISSLTFYGLTCDLECLGALEQFWAWREDWHSHLEWVKHNLRQHATSYAPALWASRSTA